MRYRALVIVPTALALLTCSQQQKKIGAEPVKLQTTREKFSYALGYDFGPNMKNLKSGVELQYFMAGLADYLNEKESLLSVGERQEVRSAEFTRIGEEYLQAQKELEQKRLEEVEAFLAANHGKPGVSTTASGLQYQVLAAGAGPTPGPNDRVKIKYRGTFMNGEEFDNTDRQAEGYNTYLVGGVFPGWTEAFQLMQAGGKYRCLIPPRLAFGKIGNVPNIPPDALLIYEIELLEILQESN
ncbi:MAG: FKBP-type peptidyl-prolyl cis-trans isomerase N-terminal domain-containing protein [candidate division KSB1 bacterium]